MDNFNLKSQYNPSGDQPEAIRKLVEGISSGSRHQVLLGATGTGKTFTMANVIETVRKPALIISHNKTLAAQLYEEMKELFPENAVEYFVSYYDYYQPEAYIPQRDIYIEKDASRNDDLDRLRLAATTSLLTRDDVIVVSSVSCIYGLGSPEEYKKNVVPVVKGDIIERDDLLGRFADVLYERNDIDFTRGTYRVRGDVVEVWPSYESYAVRVEFFGDEIESIKYINPVSGEALAEEQQVFIYPAAHYIMAQDRVQTALESIQQELDQRLAEFREQGKLLEAQRLEARTKYDMEMIAEVGFCSGIENYARHLAGLRPGAKPYTLLDYFPKDFIMFIDESHVTLPQVRAMYAGDRNRKQVLVDHGFRLPSAMDNRPLRFDEFEQRPGRTVYVSATPGDYELGLTGGEIVEQIIRPTGLLDPKVEVRPASSQVSDVKSEIYERVEAGQRVLVTVLTKRLAEDLTDFFQKEKIKCRYLHSEIDAIERVDILRDLRKGEFDVLIGINLLREGLDLPEVAMVAIMDADKEGFLRSETSLIQTIGRAARNVDSRVILYGDKVTPSMKRAMDETERRRKIQMEYNKKHNITPETIRKSIRTALSDSLKARKTARQAVSMDEKEYDKTEMVAMLEKEMMKAAEELNFEKAAKLRDKIKEFESMPKIEKKK
ncbi:Excinuclease ABC subunit B [Sedimentisphaera cyanobacteriorum]|uniref:UvrABC system protein B n=1 Tax=Sedimentisphaera cyanobacteriorum TaxID=1940790 RepID=A0A1Q2HQ43_9BACT|nr:excinuclease ABC subunit UvrB [Sedimentisphaera cyanobacteriorum]AQQ09376.1 Excinuclease ABC subunit B [Sedimentisphaera cyanobacteriorum]